MPMTRTVDDEATVTSNSSYTNQNKISLCTGTGFPTFAVKVKYDEEGIKSEVLVVPHSLTQSPSFRSLN